MKVIFNIKRFVFDQDNTILRKIETYKLLISEMKIQ